MMLRFENWFLILLVFWLGWKSKLFENNYFTKYISVGYIVSDVLLFIGGFKSFQHHTLSLKWPSQNWSCVSLHPFNIVIYQHFMSLSATNIVSGFKKKRVIIKKYQSLLYYLCSSCDTYTHTHTYMYINIKMYKYEKRKNMKKEKIVIIKKYQSLLYYLCSYCDTYTHTHTHTHVCI